MKNFTAAGFTLIELVVVVGLIGVITVATVGLLVSVLRSDRKTESQLLIKQSGDFALERMSSMIRNAQSIEGGCGSGMSSIQIKNLDGFTSQFSCGADSISSNSANLISSGAGFTITNCSFSCTSGDGGIPDSVAIQFTLGYGNDPSEEVSSTFDTTVSLRSY